MSIKRMPGCSLDIIGKIADIDNGAIRQRQLIRGTFGGLQALQNIQNE